MNRQPKNSECMKQFGYLKKEIFKNEKRTCAEEPAS